MKRRWWFLALVATLVTAPRSSFADTKQYLFNLSGGAEVPPVTTSGTGYAIATFDLDLVTMRLQLVFSGLTGTTTQAHIHCCDFQANTNAGVATQMPFFTGFPTGVTNGSMDQTYDMTLASNYRAGFLTANGESVAAALSSLIAGLDSGQAYFNVHTSAFGGGEIRGQAVLIPEPASIVLGLAATGLIAPRRRRHGR